MVQVPGSAGGVTAQVEVTLAQGGAGLLSAGAVLGTRGQPTARATAPCGRCPPSLGPAGDSEKPPWYQALCTPPAVPAPWREPSLRTGSGLPAPTCATRAHIGATRGLGRWRLAGSPCQCQSSPVPSPLRCTDGVRAQRPPPDAGLLRGCKGALGSAPHAQ